MILGSVRFAWNKPAGAGVYGRRQSVEGPLKKITQTILLLSAALLFCASLTAQNPDSRLRVGGRVAQANLVTSSQPAYPAEARQQRIQGVVILNTEIDKLGQVSDVKVISGHELLNQAAIDAVKQWRYKPFLLNGQPVDVVTTVTINFTLQ